MKLLKEKEVRRLLRIEKQTLRTFLKEGMPHLCIEGRYRFIKKEIKQWYKTIAPDQMMLEKTFIDSQGRTIEEYVLLDKVMSFLGMKKKKVLHLCENGMPFITIGTKQFFHLDDIVAHFRMASLIVKKESIEKNPAIVIVDGSYNFKTSGVGTGVVLRESEQMTGYSKEHRIYTTNSIFSEYLAILDGLLLIKEKDLQEVVFGTDQLEFVEMWNKGERLSYKWIKEAPFVDKMEKLYSLMEELKEKITLVYANVLAYKVEYENAHVLSRFYEEKQLDNLAITKAIQVPNTPPKNTRTKKTDKIRSLRIKFIEVKDGFSWFKVYWNGENRVTKINSTRPLKSAFVLAKSYVNTTADQLNIHIQKISTFKEDIAVLFDPLKQKTSKSIIKMYTSLQELTSLRMEDPFETYVKKYEKQLQIA